MPRTSALIAILLAAWPATLQASCGAEDCPLTLRTSHDAGGCFSLSLSYQYIDQDRVRVGSHPGFVGELPSPEDEIRTLSRSVTALGELRLTDRLGFTLSLPMIDRSHVHTAHEPGEPPALRNWTYSGPGDVTALGRAVLLRGAGRRPLTLSVQAGAKLPTGRRDVPAIDGDQPEPPARPGTGSTDALAGLHLMRMVSLPGWSGRRSDVSFFASLLGRLNGRGTERYRVGNEIQADLGGAYPILPSLQILGQLNARVRGKDDPGLTDALRDNTGGSWLYASPGLRLQARGVAAYAYVQLPVYERVNRIQLVAPAHWVFGTTYALIR
jgi:hypothetical protein